MSNAYMIRLEMLKMAQDALATEYHTKCDLIRTDWSNRVALAHEKRSTVPTTPELPPIYTMEQIVEKAKVLNDFVSQG
jgi:hypothetical protein